MNEIINLFESNSLGKQVFNDIFKCNEFTIEYGLVFHEEDVNEIIKTRNVALERSGRIEFNGQIINKIITAFCDSPYISQYNYSDTINELVEIFYNYKHETPGSIDYQLYIDNMNYKGIEYIDNYLETLNLENEFCYKFDIFEINELLKGYDKKCELLLVNIFELVLTNSLGLIICGKSLRHLNINSIDRKLIKNKLSRLSLEELQGALLRYADGCCEILDIRNRALINYIKKSTLKITSLINRSIELNKLETVFISFNEENNSEFVEYIDGKKLSNPVFRKLSKKIRDCSSIEYKITLIKNNIKSVEDLLDMLNAECLFGDEFFAYFKSLSQMEIILLSKRVEELSFDNECEKEWCLEFNEYISSLSEEEQVRIEKLKERILLT